MRWQRLGHQGDATGPAAPRPWYEKLFGPNTAGDRYNTVCPECDGTGVCPACHGQGLVEDPNRQGSRW